MNTHRASLHVIVLFAFHCFPIFASAAELCFATMEDGDRVEITHSSKGCFHDWTRYFEVSRQDGILEFREYAITWKKRIPPTIAEKKVMGELTVTKNEIAGLDSFLRFHREKKNGFSTTESSLLVEYFEGSKRVGAENLHDSTGGHGLESRKDIVQFSELAARFQK